MTIMRDIPDATALAIASCDLTDLIEERPYVIDVVWLDELAEQVDEARRIAECLREQVASMNLELAVAVTQRYNRVTISRKG